MANFRAGLKISKETGDRESEALCYHNIGLLFSNSGDYPEALDYYYKALNIREQMGARQVIAQTQDNIGSILASQKKYKEAQAMFNQSLSTRKTLGDREGIARSLMYLGDLHANAGEGKAALDKYFESLKICQEIGDKEDEAILMSSIGKAFYDAGSDSTALSYFDQALRISKEIGDLPSTARTNIMRAKVNLRARNFEKAREELRDALDYARKTGTREMLSTGYTVLSSLDSAQGNFFQALQEYKLSQIYKDSILNDANNKISSLIQARYETEKKDREIELLNKDREINLLRLKEQAASLMAKNLEASAKQDQIRLLNNSYELQQLTLSRTMEDLRLQQAEVKAKTTAVALLNKEKELQKAQLDRQWLIRNVMLGGTILLVLLFIVLLRSLQLRKRLERREAVDRERRRISADLHDEIGSGLSRISLLTELLKKEAGTPAATKGAEKIAAVSGELSGNISEIIWALNTNNDQLENLVAYIRRYAAGYFENSPVGLKISLPDAIPDLPVSGEHRRCIFYAVKEALHNIVKHAEATEARLEIKFHGEFLYVTVSDNGKGIHHEGKNRFGNGLVNMEERMTSIGGTLRIDNHIGATVTLSMPV